LEAKTITHQERVFSTAWFSVLAKTVNGQGAPFYSLEQLDYVTVLAVTPHREILLVRQYRPAVERYTLELPGGHVEPGEEPEYAARRELLEETGFQAERLELLGTLVPDSGRLSNRLWCFFAGELKQVSSTPEFEQGDALLACKPTELLDYIVDSRFDHALHLAIVLLALSKQKLSLGDCE